MEDKLIEKIKKMMNITLENGATEGEVYNATVQAQRLMAKHGISTSDIEQSKNPMAVLEDKITDCRIRVDYESALAHLIASNFRCDLYFRVTRTHTLRGGTRRESYAVFVGLPEDVATAREVFIRTYKFMDVMKRRHAEKKAQERRQAHDDYAEWSNGLNFGDAAGYAKGFISGLREKLRDSKRQLNKEYAVALVVPTEVDARMKELKKDFKKGAVIAPQSLKGNHDSFVKGTADGKAFDSQIE